MNLINLISIIILLVHTFNKYKFNYIVKILYYMHYIVINYNIIFIKIKSLKGDLFI